MVARRTLDAPAGLGRAGRPRSLRGPGRRRAGGRRPAGRGRRDPRAAAAPLDDDAGLLRDARAHARGVPQPLVPHGRRRALRRATGTCGSSTGSRTGSAAAARTSRRPTSSTCSARTRRSPRRRSSRSPPDEEGGEDEIKAVVVAARGASSTPRRSGRGATSGSPTSPCRVTWRSCPSCRRRRRRRCARASSEMRVSRR